MPTSGMFKGHLDELEVVFFIFVNFFKASIDV
ncbi:hypothetical protein [Crassaminicella profunda]